MKIQCTLPIARCPAFSMWTNTSRPMRSSWKSSQDPTNLSTLLRNAMKAKCLISAWKWRVRSARRILMSPNLPSKIDNPAILITNWSLGPLSKTSLRGVNWSRNLPRKRVIWSVQMPISMFFRMPTPRGRYGALSSVLTTRSYSACSVSIVPWCKSVVPKRMTRTQGQSRNNLSTGLSSMAAPTPICRNSSQWDRTFHLPSTTWCKKRWPTRTIRWRVRIWQTSECLSRYALSTQKCLGPRKSNSERQLWMLWECIQTSPTPRSPTSSTLKWTASFDTTRDKKMTTSGSVSSSSTLCALASPRSLTVRMLSTSYLTIRMRTVRQNRSRRPDSRRNRSLKRESPSSHSLRMHLLSAM